MMAALYCRLSEEDRHKAPEEDSGSIQNQKAMLLAYAQARGWTVYQIYSDDDYTGSDRSRPAFQRLLRDAEAGRFDVVLCKTQSRFTRELELVERYLHGLFPLWGVRFVSIVDHADTASRGNKKSRQINGLVNEWYLEDLSDNIRSVLSSRRRSGLHIGSTALYGYRKDPDQKGHLAVDPEAAEVVLQVFTLYTQGYGKTAIARLLNSRGEPSPSEYKYLHGLLPRPKGAHTPALWSYAAISSMLTNEMYLGNMVQGRYGSVSYKTKQNRPRPREDWYIVPNTHPPIVPRPLWDAAQIRLGRHSQPAAGGRLGLFAGKVRCRVCGRLLRSTGSRGRRYLQCPTPALTGGGCPGAFLSVKALEEAVLEELRPLLANALDKKALLALFAKRQTDLGRRDRIRSALAEAETQALRCSGDLQTLYRDRLRGILPEEDFAALAQELTRQREHWRSRIASLQEQHSAGPEAEPEEAAAPWLCPEHLTRTMVDALIDRITVGRKGPGQRQTPVEIFWRF